MNIILINACNHIAKSIPFILQMMLIFSLPLVDSSVMSLLGKDSAIAGSSVGIILSSFFTIIYSITFGASSYLSQSYLKDKIIFFSYFKIISVLSVLSSILISASYYCFTNFFHNFTSIPSVDKQLSYYIEFFPLITLLYSFSCIIDLYLYNSNNSRKCLYLTSLEVVTNIILSIYLGLYCNMQEISGVSGVAISSVIAKFFKIIFFLISKNTFDVIYSTINETINKKFMRDALFKTMPYSFNSVMWVGYGYIIYKLVLNMPYEDMFIFSIMIPWINFCFTVPSGFSNYYSIAMAKNIVKGNVSNLEISVVLSVFSIVVISVFSLLLLVFNSVYSDITNHLSIKSVIFILVVIFVLLRAENILLSNGLLKSGLDNFFVFSIDTIVMWVVCFPMFFYYSQQPIFTLEVVFTFYVIEEILKGVCYFFRVRSKKWIVNFIDVN